MSVNEDPYQEALDDPNIPLALRLKIFAELDQVNEKFGTSRKYIAEWNRWFHKSGIGREKKVLRLLELGSGGGSLIRRLAQWGKKNSVEIEFHSMDLDPRVLEWTQKRLKLRHIDLITHVSGDQHLKQFAPGSFDVIYSLHVLHHIQPFATLSSALNDCYRVARQGVFHADFDQRRSLLFIHRLSQFFAPTSPELAHDGYLSCLRSYASRAALAEAQKVSDPSWTHELKCLKIYPYFFLKSHRSVNS